MAGQLRLLLVGAGAMGGALLRGWLEKRTARPEDVAVIDPDPAEAVQKLCNAHGVKLNPADPGRSGVDAVVYAVKPHLISEVMANGPAAPADALRLSVAAGRTVASLKAASPEGAPVARAMPNLPVAIGEGAVGLYAAPDVDPPRRAVAERLMEAVGRVVWVSSESDLDALTVISGSGPAYVFALAEALQKAGVARGLSADVAAALARQTVIGAGAMLAADPSEPGDLRRAVTSPGGTTQAALKVLLRDGNGLDALLDEATAAAAQRTADMSK